MTAVQNDARTPIGADDFRAVSPRFSTAARPANRAIVDLVKGIALRRRATPAQVALARRPWIVPIPGTRRLPRLEENLGAASLDLTAGDLAELDDGLARNPIQGARLPDGVLRLTHK